MELHRSRTSFRTVDTMKITFQRVHDRFNGVSGRVAYTVFVR